MFNEIFENILLTPKMFEGYKKEAKDITIDLKSLRLNGLLYLPKTCKGLVIFCHGSGSSRFSPRNQFVASFFGKHNLGTLLFDLLTLEEEEVDNATREFRFDINLLAERLIKVTSWVLMQKKLKDLNLGYFGSSTGAAGALIAAAYHIGHIKAVVSRGGRADLAREALSEVQPPTLLIVGSLDYSVIELNKEAQSQMRNKNKLYIVEGATHLFEEPGTLEEVALVAKDWFLMNL